MIKSKSLLSNKTIFITGGTGSFGKFFVTEALKQNPKKIIIFSRDEDKQYSMQFEFAKFLPKLKFVIGDVRDRERLIEVVDDEKIDILIHAAAMKQIPIAEENIVEVVKTNVLGAQNVVGVAKEAGIAKVIAISTDKVVEPVNAYGMTKALQEKIFIKNNFSCVRYGNVINSRGSVIPLFKKQIDLGQSLTITNKEMTRFILPLSEATNLVFSAIESMKGGEIFVPKIKPLKIIDLAQAMVQEFGSSKNKIVEIGTRAGEKIHEILISESELKFTSEYKDYYVINHKLNSGKLSKITKYSSDQHTFLSKTEIRDILKSCKFSNY